MISLVIGILITIVLGAILFWVIDRFCPDARLAKLLKLLVVLVCLGSISKPLASHARLSIVLVTMTAISKASRQKHWFG